MIKITTAGLNAALSSLGLDESNANDKGWASTMCPACGGGGTNSTSLRVNVYNGEYKCFRCGATSQGKEGVPLDVFVGNPETPNLSVTTGDLPVLTKELVSRYNRILNDSPDVVTELERKRGWTQDTVNRLGIGYDGSHFWLPIYDTGGRLVNARLYDPFKRSRVKSFHYTNAEGLRRTAVWVPNGVESLKDHKTIWLFEGEPDVILASQLGFPAAVITGGSGTWDDEIVQVVGDRRVVLCYDMDTAGMKGARSIKARLESHDIEALHLKFSLSRSEYNDFTDAIMKDARTTKWFKKLAVEQWKGSQDDGGDAPPPPIVVRLGGGVPNEPIVVKSHVLGTHDVPVLAPQLIEARCRMNWDEDKCKNCPASRANGHLKQEVDPESELMMQLAVTPARGQKAMFKHMMGTPNKCPLVEFSIGGFWQLQHLKLIPPMMERAGGDSTVRSAIYVSPSDGAPPPIRPNQLYLFEGKIVPDVKTNEWTLVSCSARPAEDDVDSFRLDAEMVNALRDEFNPPSWTPEAIHEKMLTEERSIARHITKVYGRDELLRAVDVCYHSVIKFSFRGRTPQRGWLSLGIFGDTRTGKSETMSTFSQYLGFGKYILDPANTTFAGLVGGLQQVGGGDKAWAITWGLIPTNDRGLVIVDELSSLSTDDIGKMSGMRSSGVAEITKIRSSSTPARTRLIMAGNPRGLGRRLSSYATPVEGFMELIGAPEDVARFDLAVAVEQGLDKDEADKRLGDQPQPVMIDLRRALVRFAWSRRHDQVEFEPEAEEAAARLGNEMAKKYSHHIPLVEPSEQDIKLARVAVAFAVRTFSVTESDPNIVLVRKCHVDMAKRFMENSYNGALKYDAYSEFLNRQALNEEAVTAILVKHDSDVSATCRALLTVRRVNPNTIGMTMALSGEEARGFIAELARHGAARFDHENSRNTAMSWTPDFMKLLRRMEHSPPELPTEGLGVEF